MNYWLHRISHIAKLSYPLLDRGYLTIGFRDFTEENIIQKVKEGNGDWDYFNKQFEDNWGRLPRTRHNLWKFLRFRKGDIVVVPSWNGTFLVCEIIGEKALEINKVYSENLKTWDNKPVRLNGKWLGSDDGELYDLGFAWEVKVLHRDISRSKFADAKLTSRMKIRQTNAKINDLKDSIQSSLTNFKENRPIHLHSIIVERTADLVLDSIKCELNPDKFEKLLKLYFKTIGANDVSIPPKNGKDKEGDADIVAVFESLKLIIYAQAKFQYGQINEWGTNQVLDYKTNQDSIDDGYNKIAWVITTANSFSDEAERIAAENEIQLIDGIEFSKMILNAGISLLDTNL